MVAGGIGKRTRVVRVVKMELGVSEWVALLAEVEMKGQEILAQVILMMCHCL